MHLSSDVQIPDGLLAANALLAENSRQGFETYSGTLHQGFGFVISHTSLGIIGPLYDGDVRSRSTGKERDAESGLDYFGARYYASTMGRWMSPDWAAKAEPVPYAKMDNPQSLNLYQFVGNNPLSRADADGHDFWDKLSNALHGNGWHDTPRPTPAPAAPVPGPPAAAVRAGMTAYHPNPGGESVAQIAGRVNHETNGMKDSPGENKPLGQAKEEIAASRMNAEAQYGDQVQQRAGMASPTMSGPGYPAAVDATISAAEARITGNDPTNGAIQYNMRTDSQAAGGGPFQGQPVQTQSGPYQSPTKYDWVFTYGPPH